MMTPTIMITTATTMMTVGVDAVGVDAVGVDDMEVKHTMVHVT